MTLIFKLSNADSIYSILMTVFADVNALVYIITFKVNIFQFSISLALLKVTPRV